MKKAAQYATYRKPTWAPPAWLFAPVWTVLYILIALSFGYVLFLYIQSAVPLIVLLPFILNLIFNFAYTYIQFRLRNYVLATADTILILGTLAWSLIGIYQYATWVVYANLPYLAWVCFATVLQISVTLLNRK